MKHVLIVLFSIILVSSFAFSQSNESSVDQSGVDHIGQVSQTGTSHDATILQVGSEHKAYITQLGTNNIGIVQTKSGTGSIARITQYTGSEDNYAIIDQWGSGQDAQQHQYGNDQWAGIYQTGMGYHTAYQLQTGNNNQALMNTQDNVWGSSAGSAAHQLQHGENNKANLRQYGPDNFARQYQDGVSNWAGERWYEYGIEQDGEGNIAYQNQYIGWNKAEIFQVNEGNNATVNQWGLDTAGFFVNEAIVNQDGTGNAAVVNQTYTP